MSSSSSRPVFNGAQRPVVAIYDPPITGRTVWHRGWRYWVERLLGLRARRLKVRRLHREMDKWYRMHRDIRWRLRHAWGAERDELETMNEKVLFEMRRIKGELDWLAR